MDKLILHSDLNNFYASVECLYRPEIRKFPVAVCGDPELRHGIVLAKNQKAKVLGIKTGEVIHSAKNKCPDLVIVPPNMELYNKFSRWVHEIYEEYSDYIQDYGCDEAWIDVSSIARDEQDAKIIADEIRCRIKEELCVTCSVGVSF
ncbi:MAG: DNA polymerase IV, partial [Oscillospiraceae bacterium]|nr:DNA polymerase IV [Oscillospiraceae bacterium]